MLLSEESKQTPTDIVTEQNFGKKRKPWQAPKVKTLSEEDLDNYNIFDVIMPLPGRDVAYPGGVLGERYQELINADGLDPHDWERKQK